MSKYIFDHKYCENSSIVKYYYNLKWLLWIISRHCSYHQCHMILQNHFNIIWCSRQFLVLSMLNTVVLLYIFFVETLRPFNLYLIDLESVFQEKERLANLERRYQSLTGGKTFPKSSNTMKEVSRTVIICFMSIYAWLQIWLLNICSHAWS